MEPNETTTLEAANGRGLGELPHLAASMAPDVVLPRIGPAALRRLNRLHAQAEMMGSLAQQTQNNLQVAAVAACEDIGLAVPRGANIDVDFATGVINVMMPDPNGSQP